MSVYFNFFNSNESIFYTLIKVTIHHMIKIMQRIKIKLIIIKFNIDIISFELQYILDSDKKIHNNYIKFLYYNKY